MARRKPGVPVRLTDSMVTSCHLGAALYVMNNPSEVDEIGDIKEALSLLPDYVGRTNRIRRFHSSKSRVGAPKPPPKSAIYRFKPSDVPKVIKLLRVAADIPSSAMLQISYALDNRADELEKLDTVSLLGYAAL